MLKDLIAKVREADAAFDKARHSDDDSTAWNAKRDARRALRDAVYNQLCVSVDELHQLTRG